MRNLIHAISAESLIVARNSGLVCDDVGLILLCSHKSDQAGKTLNLRDVIPLKYTTLPSLETGQRNTFVFDNKWLVSREPGLELRRRVAWGELAAFE